MSSYLNEQSLVNDFVQHVQLAVQPWGDVRVLREFLYRGGRTDVVLLTGAGDVLAFEAKLNRWRIALHQAYRNTCYAHHSYVILPEDIALAAHRYAYEFDRRGVGLCYLRDGRLVVLRDSPRSEPLQPWLCSRARALAEGGEAHVGDGP